jgi:hypothetical protein
VDAWGLYREVPAFFTPQQFCFSISGIMPIRKPRVKDLKKHNDEGRAISFAIKNARAILLTIGQCY